MHGCKNADSGPVAQRLRGGRVMTDEFMAKYYAYTYTGSYLILN